MSRKIVERIQEMSYDELKSIIMKNKFKKEFMNRNQSKEEQFKIMIEISAKVYGSITKYVLSKEGLEYTVKNVKENNSDDILLFLSLLLNYEQSFKSLEKIENMIDKIYKKE